MRSQKQEALCLQPPRQPLVNFYLLFMTFRLFNRCSLLPPVILVWHSLQAQSQPNTAETRRMPREPAPQTQLDWSDRDHLLLVMLLSSFWLVSELRGGGLWRSDCPACDKGQLFTTLHLTYSLTPRSLSPTPTSPCSPCSPLHAFHFWR